VSSASITAEPPAQAAPPVGDSGPGLRRYAIAAAFLAPAIVLLGVWIVYPAIYTPSSTIAGARNAAAIA